MSELDTDLSDTPNPGMDVGRTPARHAYSKILHDQLSNRFASQRYRQAAYDRIAGTTRAGEEAYRDMGAQTYGFNNPSGMTTALIANQRARAPYASADLLAREAGRQSSINTGRALMDKQQSHANLYATYVSPYLQNKEIENNAALGLAQMAAAGGSGASGSSSSATTTAAIGAGGSIVSALILSGAI